MLSRFRAFVLFSSIAAILFIFNQCETTIGPEQPNAVPLARLAIEDARALFVEVNQDASSITGVIRKLTETGEVKDVPYISESGDSLSTQSLPVDIFPAGENYFSIGFLVNSNQGYQPNLSALIDVNTGDAVTFGNLYPSRQTYFLNTGTVQTDNEGNLYMMNLFQEGAGRQYVYKIDPTASDPNAVRVTPDDMDVGWWFVDGAGNIAISVPDAFVSGETPYLIEPSGGQTELPNINFWVSALGDLYLDAFSSQDTTYDILKISAVDDTISADTVSANMEVPILYRTGEKLLLTTQQRTLIVLNSATAGHRAFDVTDGETPEEVMGIIDQFETYVTATSTDDYHYIYGEAPGGSPLLIKVDPVNYTTTTVSTGYEIVRMSASNTTEDEILFTGTRAGDDVPMVGLINGSGVSLLADSMATAAPGLIFLD